VSHWNGMGPNGAILRGVPMTIMGAENKWKKALLELTRYIFWRNEWIESQILHENLTSWFPSIFNLKNIYVLLENRKNCMRIGLIAIYIV
jgi:hypothetical protein